MRMTFYSLQKMIYGKKFSLASYRERNIRMKGFYIKEACGENWQGMSETNCGKFCHSCEKEVIDTTSFTKDELKVFLKNRIHALPCMRMTNHQLDELNTDFQNWNSSNYYTQSSLLWVLLVVFGLGLFSCQDEQQQSMILELQKNAKESWTEVSKPTLEEQHSSLISNDLSYRVVDQTIACEGPEDIPEQVGDSVEVLLPEVAIYNERHYVVTMGVPLRTHQFEQFLIENIDVNVVEEFDENGRRIPMESDAKAFPNPTIGQTTLELGLSQSGNYRVFLVNLSGQILETIHEGNLEKGYRSFEASLQAYPSGSYLFVIQSDVFSKSVRVVKI